MPHWKFWKSKKPCRKAEIKEFESRACQTETREMVSVGTAYDTPPTAKPPMKQQEQRQMKKRRDLNYSRKALLRVVYVQVKNIGGQFFCRTFLKTYRLVTRPKNKAEKSAVSK